MPSDFSTSMDFGDLLLELALFSHLVGYGADGNEEAQIPAAGSEDRRRLEDYANRGYDLFLRSDPEWTFLIATVPLTFSSDGTAPDIIDPADAARYRLPSYCQHQPLGNWQYAPAANVSSREIAVISWDALNAMRVDANNQSTGLPKWSACRRIPAGEGRTKERDRWEAVFFPTPNADYAISNTFRIRSHKLVETSDRHCAGADHDRAIMAAMKYEWAKDDQTMESERDRYAQDYQAQLAGSVAIDKRDRGRRVGQLRDTDEIASGLDRRDRLPRCTTLDGVTIPQTI